MKSRHLLMIAGVILATAAGPALAHHSAAQYDRARPLVIKGQVKDLQWANPHSLLEIEAAGSAGKRVNWLIELEGPKVMTREGWTLHSVLPGDEVTARIMPLKDGRPGARLVELQRADGSTFHLFTPRATGA
jgi:hypothetical protein